MAKDQSLILIRATCLEFLGLTKVKIKEVALLASSIHLQVKTKVQLLEACLEDQLKLNQPIQQE